jgi:hypothetical protein
MLERKLLFDPIAKDFRCSTCGWVRTIPRWIAADFSHERELRDAFERHKCGEHPLPFEAQRQDELQVGHAGALVRWVDADSL